MKTLTAAALLAVAGLAVGQEKCGVPAIPPELVDLSIIGGRDAKPGSWPWHVGLYEKPWVDYPPYNHGQHFCAGALIDEQTVVTAAHCMARSPKSTRIHLGAHKRTSKDDGEEYVNVAHFCSHPKWKSGNSDDIGIIRLENPVTYTDTISPICLPDSTDEVRIGKDDVYVTGWGFTTPFGQRQAEDLKQAKQAIITKKECHQMRSIDVSKIICSKHDLGSSCHGDSGGPLVLERDNRWQLQGVVSGGPPVCGTKDWPMYYTEVAKYRDWIDRYRKSADPLNDSGLCKEGVK